MNDPLTDLAEIPPNRVSMSNYINRFNFGADDDNVGGNIDSVWLRRVTGPEHVFQLMKNLHWEQKLSIPILDATFDLMEAGLSRDLLVYKTREFFRARAVLVPDGIETLPACWLKSVPDLFLRTLKPHWNHVPYMTTGLRLENGVLCMSFAQELPNSEKRFTRWDELRATINRSLRPNLWQPLSPEQKNLLWNGRPDLRAELLRMRS